VSFSYGTGTTSLGSYTTRIYFTSKLNMGQLNSLRLAGKIDYSGVGTLRSQKLGHESEVVPLPPEE
jgi:hypothetical protein